LKREELKSCPYDSLLFKGRAREGMGWMKGNGSKLAPMPDVWEVKSRMEDKLWMVIF
jgi:hypothetical protein